MHVQDLQTKKIGGGHERDGLYCLNGVSTVDANGLAASSIIPLLWHSRLGHLSLFKLQQIIPECKSISTLECEACELGKHHRSSFPSHNDSCASTLLELVHSDIWGPSRIASRNGFKYFVTFVDDYSRLTWLYMLHDRS